MLITPARGLSKVVLAALFVAGCGPDPDYGIVCDVDEDCVYEDIPYCVPGYSRGRCTAPCEFLTSDHDLVCVDGRPTPICIPGAEPRPGCVPFRLPGESCGRDYHCVSGDCSGGTCGSAQGDPCTPDTCDGICAAASDGATYCIRECSRTTGCEDSEAGGLTWDCIQIESTGQCVPREDCDRGLEDYLNPCSTFDGGKCADAYSTDDGETFTFCAPPELAH